MTIVVPAGFESTVYAELGKIWAKARPTASRKPRPVQNPVEMISIAQSLVAASKLTNSPQTREKLVARAEEKFASASSTDEELLVNRKSRANPVIKKVKTRKSKKLRDFRVNLANAGLTDYVVGDSSAEEKRNTGDEVIVKNSMTGQLTKKSNRGEWLVFDESRIVSGAYPDPILTIDNKMNLSEPELVLWCSQNYFHLVKGLKLKLVHMRDGDQVYTALEYLSHINASIYDDYEDY